MKTYNLINQWNQLPYSVQSAIELINIYTEDIDVLQAHVICTKHGYGFNQNEIGEVCNVWKLNKKQQENINIVYSTKDVNNMKYGRVLTY